MNAAYKETASTVVRRQGEHVEPRIKAYGQELVELLVLLVLQ
jgi:hypothetical protein